VIVCGPFYPRAIVRLGLKRCIVSGIVFAAAILLLMPLWPSVPLWLVLRFVAGCALGLVWIASEIWMNSVSGTESRGTVMGIYGTVFSIGIVAGPILLEFTGTEGAKPFAIGAACLILTLLPLAVLRRVTSAAQEFTPLRGLSGALKTAPIVMLAALVAGLVEGDSECSKSRRDLTQPLPRLALVLGDECEEVDLARRNEPVAADCLVDRSVNDAGRLDSAATNASGEALGRTQRVAAPERIRPPVRPRQEARVHQRRRDASKRFSGRRHRCLP